MASETPNPESSAPWTSFLERHLRRHIGVYAVVVVLAVMLNVISPADRGLFIPILLWGVLVLAHFLTVRALNTDPDWVDERSEMITMNASDLSHIENIRERHDKRMADEAEQQADTDTDNKKAD